MPEAAAEDTQAIRSRNHRRETVSSWGRGAPEPLHALPAVSECRDHRTFRPLEHLMTRSERKYLAAGTIVGLVIGLLLALIIVAKPELFAALGR